MDGAKAQKQLGSAIRKRRLELKFSQDSFADHIEMHRAYYSAVERGERNLTLRLLQKIAEGLRLSLAALFGSAKL